MEIERRLSIQEMKIGDIVAYKIGSSSNPHPALIVNIGEECINVIVISSTYHKEICIREIKNTDTRFLSKPSWLTRTFAVIKVPKENNGILFTGVWENKRSLYTIVKKYQNYREMLKF